jgi:serine/threonine-protein kinase RsbW
MAASASLRLDPNRSECTRLNDTLTRFAAEHTIDDAAVYAVRLALEELFVNTVSYGCEDKKEHWIEVRLILEPWSVRVEIEDNAAPFNPLEQNIPGEGEAHQRDEDGGGIGIYLIRHLIDKLEYRRTAEGNLLTMWKHRETPTHPMTIQTSTLSDVTLVSISGSLDPNGAIELKGSLKPILESPVKKLVFDLSNLDYTGSAGLREFFMAAKTLDRAGGKMAIFGLQKEVHRVFDMAGFAITYPVVDTLTEAIDKVK